MNVHSKPSRYSKPTELYIYDSGYLKNRITIFTNCNTQNFNKYNQTTYE